MSLGLTDIWEKKQPTPLRSAEHVFLKNIYARD